MANRQRIFSKVSDRSLAEMASELETIGHEPVDSSNAKPIFFARCLSILMKCELANRTRDEDWHDGPLPGFPDA